ncbi:DUF6270 domain-containing protein [Phenylobacterium sp.]|uniref:DUF6270 domain-containing protein n=1 Tax=Phenylobacterium sp. TaxID=1871053 RepID=UPI0025FFEA9A|nr:DUF6270 domain-containing protein [Phenylobacterium sp.]MCA3716040.1 hypothetical protein [Phenylobacterium sp.]
MTGSSRLTPPLAGAGRVAILGSCVTRDLWRMAGAPADDLLYISRTRLPSLFAVRPEGLVLPEGPAPGLRPNPAQALRTDLSKTGLAKLAGFRPDLVILDFIDERFDLLVGAGGVVTASWELETSGWDALPPLLTLRRLDALGDADATLWRRSLDALATLFAPGGALSGARPVLHEAVWAPALRTPAGRTEPLAPDLEITPGRRASRAAHNARLARMHAAARGAMPGLTVVKAPESLIFSDPDHVWGQSPFHYVPDYYAEIWRQLGGG